MPDEPTEEPPEATPQTTDEKIVDLHRILLNLADELYYLNSDPNLRISSEPADEDDLLPDSATED